MTSDRKSFHVGGIVCLAAVLLLAVPTDAPVLGQSGDVSREDAKRKLQDVKDKLKRARETEQGISGDIKALAADEVKLNKQLIQTAGRIQSGEAKLTAIEGRLGELAAQQSLIRGSIAQRHDAIAKLLATMQRMGRQPPPVIITRRGDALKMVRSAMLLASIFPELKYQAETLAHDLADLESVEKKITADRDDLRRTGDELAIEQRRIQQLLAAKKATLAARRAALSGARRTVAGFAKTVGSLGELITRIDSEVEARRELRRRAAIPARDGGKVIELKPKATKVALLTPGRMKIARPFAKLRGGLPLPAKGIRLSGFGQKDQFGRKVQGISISTRTRAQITSPCDGWIKYAGPFRTYGQLLIIDAGGGYHVLLAGMNRIDASLGQFVLAGEPIGVMGAPQKSEERAEGQKDRQPVLYVEFRKDGRPIDPDPWWASGPEKARG